MTERRPKACRFAGVDQPRMLRTHLRGCETPGCEGCEPCGERHCGMCGSRHLGELARTCGRCVGAVRDGIAAILAKSALLLEEAARRGVNSEAAMLAGPAADVDRWQARYLLAFWGRIDAAWLEDCHDELHPKWVLGTWDLEVCRFYGHDRTLGVTLTSAAAYLSGHLSALAQDPAFRFGEMAEHVRRCLAHLEAVLHDADPTVRGVHCPACYDPEDLNDAGHNASPRLVKDYAPLVVVGARCRVCGTETDQLEADRCPDRWCWSVAPPIELVESDEGDDGWSCPRCSQWWTDRDYRQRVGAGYLLHADRLTADDLERAHRVKAGTIRVWAHRELVAKRGRDASGRQLYDVADVLAQRDRTARLDKLAETS